MDSECKPTHGIGFECVTLDGVERSMALFLLSDGSYGIDMQTKRPEASEPLMTQIKLSPFGLAMLRRLLVEADRINEHPLPGEAAEQANDYSTAKRGVTRQSNTRLLPRRIGKCPQESCTSSVLAA